MDTRSVIGLPVAVTDYDAAVIEIKRMARDGTRVFAVEAANTHVASLARQDEKFGASMRRFDLICPDGMPLVWAVNRQVGRSEVLKDRVYGPTLMLRTLEGTAGEGQYRHFLLGGQQSTLDRLSERFARDFPGAAIAGVYSPPFGEWPPDEFDRIAGMIRDTGANLIWVGLGCPKQEHWIAENKDRLPPGVYFGIGAAFAFHAGEVRQAPAWIQRAGMEWLYRLAAEPRRLWKRYFTYNSLFIYYYVRDKVARST
jgi:N-acetylglucosaminyldiphosphoundecaprenol N-acetyl-beta-D-mannosaminyltransferase